VRAGGVHPCPDIQTKKGDGMKRLHLHVVVESLPDAIRFYSGLFDAAPCCGGKRYANWRVDQPPLNLAASLADRPTGIAHFGIEAESPSELSRIDRVLRSGSRARAIPWEVSVRKQPVRQRAGKEHTS
jgi:hypothetical protein